jgi:hypothetical protein
MYEVFSVSCSSDGSIVGVLPSFMDSFYDGGSSVFVYLENQDDSISPVEVSEIDGDSVLSEYKGSLDEVLDSFSYGQVYEDFYVLDYGGIESLSCSYSKFHDGYCDDTRFVMGGFDCCYSSIGSIQLEGRFNVSHGSYFECEYCSEKYRFESCYCLGDDFGIYRAPICIDCYDRFVSVLEKVDYSVVNDIAVSLSI